MNLRLAALIVCLGSAALAQDEKSGRFLDKERQVSFAVPEGWTLRTKDFQGAWGAPALLEFANADKTIRGAVTHEPAAQKVERYAEKVHKALESAPGMRGLKKLREETLKRSPGTWLRRDYEVDQEDNDYRRVHVFANHGKHNVQLVVGCPATLWDEAKAAVQAAIDGLLIGEDAFGVDTYTNHDVNVAFQYPAAWERRSKDFQFGDPNAAFECNRGDQIMVTLGIVTFDAERLEAKTWADNSMKAFEESMQNIKLIAGRTVGECERRDFRADIGGSATRLAFVVWPNQAKKKGVYIYAWTTEDAWEQHAARIESVLGSFKTGIEEPKK